MNNLRTMQVMDDSQYFTFDPHRVPFSGIDEPVFECSVIEIQAMDAGESIEIDVGQFETESEC